MIVASDAGDIAAQQTLAKTISQVFEQVDKAAFTVGSELVIDGGLSNL